MNASSLPADPFERRVRCLRLGLPDWRLGPFTLRRRGAMYSVSPLSLLAARQFMEANEKAWRVLVRHAELGGQNEALPVELLRCLVPLMVDGPLDPCHQAAATDEQLNTLLLAFGVVNDVPLIVRGLAHLQRAPGAWRTFLVDLGEAFGCWPAEILRRPAQAVFAIGEELNLIPSAGEEHRRANAPGKGL